jgi:hypothetical protein
VEVLSPEITDLLSLKQLLFESAPQALAAEKERSFLRYRNRTLAGTPSQTSEVVRKPGSDFLGLSTPVSQPAYVG